MKSEYTIHYEDWYEASVNEAFEEVLAMFEALAAPESPFAHLNVPVWIDVTMIEGERAVVVGVMQPRTGRTVQWIAPATLEQVQHLRKLMLRVWAARADTGFARWEHSHDRYIAAE